MGRGMRRREGLWILLEAGVVNVIFDTISCRESLNVDSLSEL